MVASRHSTSLPSIQILPSRSAIDIALSSETAARLQAATGGPAILFGAGQLPEDGAAAVKADDDLGAALVGPSEHVVVAAAADPAPEAARHADHLHQQHALLQLGV